MKISYYDETVFKNIDIEVVENVVGLKKKLKMVALQKKVSKLIRKQLNDNSYKFTEAVKEDIEDKIEWFSQKARPILKKICDGAMPASLKDNELFILIVDVIMPIAYEKTEINKNNFWYFWVINTSKYIWADMDPNLKKCFWNFCNGNEVIFKDVKLDYTESNERDLLSIVERFPEIKVYRSLMMNPEEALQGLMKFRSNLSNKLWGYLLRSVYKANTLGIKTETLHDAFNGVDKEELMDEEEIEAFNNLKDEIIIYRGTDREEIIPRLSWSLDKEYAKKYDKGRFFVAKIRKENVLAYWPDKEEEILAWVNKDDLLNW